MSRNNKIKFVEDLLQNAVEELELMGYSDSEADEILDELDDNLTTISLFRYSFRSYVPKNESWFESTLPSLDAGRFKMLLRVSREQFEYILKLIEDHEVFHGKNSEKQFTPYFQLALVLYKLGSSGEGSTLGKIASLFGIGDGGTISKVTDRVFESILALEKTFIKWPSEEEREEIICDAIDELPHCIGYIDGSEIPLDEAPILDHTSYYSRCKQYSIKLQAVCDPNYRIRHVMVGYPGSVHDAKIFANSGLGKNTKKFVSGEQWIAGDSAYKLTTHIITLFRKNSKEETPEIRTKFNKIFSKYRVRIEHCFGFLKEKFNSLKGLKIRISSVESHMFACKWIRVCCILHNIILPYLDENELELFALTFNENTDDEDETSDYSNSEYENNGLLKRKVLCQLLTE